MPTFDINDLSMNVERVGSGPPLVLLHGFTGSAESWAEHVCAFGEHFTTYAIDLIGHGKTESPVEPSHYCMTQCVEDVISLLDRLGITSTALLGYSMGGRVAMYVAAAAQERIRALVLESASPGIADPDERAARVKSDVALADFIEREGLEAFVDRWERVPLFASQQRLPWDVQQRYRAQRLRNNPVGLANSLRGMGAGAMEPVWDRLGSLIMPVALIAGELDEKYVEISKTMETVIPNSHLLIVPDVGHTVHLEAPEIYDRTVLNWLAKVMA